MKKIFCIVTVIIALVMILALCTIAFSVIVKINRDRAIEAIEEKDYETLEKVTKYRLFYSPIDQFLGEFFSAFAELTYHTPLEIACLNQDIKATEILLKNGADPNFKHFIGHSGTYIDYAIAYGNVELLELLLQYGATEICGNPHPPFLYSPFLSFFKNMRTMGFSGEKSLERFIEIDKLLRNYNLINDGNYNGVFQAVSLTSQKEVIRYNIFRKIRKRAKKIDIF